jgi:uncharacterized protein YfaS (alpha-2-macroglobulin family)
VPFQNLIALFLLLPLVFPLCAQEQEDTEPFFSLTSERTYLPGEKPTVSVYSHNVGTLEFRVYRINDSLKFFSQMQELHNFGGRGPTMPKQARTWLEKLHAWKHRIWAWFRDFIRAQFSPDSRHKIRLWEMGKSEKKQGPTVEGYAQVPILNPQQVVSVWKWTVPAHERWESQAVPIPVSDKGVYLVEATNGKLRAYTVIVVTEIAIITKAAPGRLMSLVVDRRSGDPIPGAMLRVWIDQQEVAANATDQNGLLDTSLDQAKPENVAVLATSGDQFAINTPSAWNLGTGSDRNLKGFTYSDRPVYRPGDIVHFRTIVRAESTTGYEIPKQRDLRLELRDPQNYQTIWQQTVTLNDLGTAHWDYAIPADANLGFYYLSMQMGDRYVEGVSFSVEDYKKPEYQVKVTALTPRVLEGQTIKAMIDARYYFGEPVANAKVKWVVHTSTYWPLGRANNDDEASEYQGGENPDAGQGDNYGGEQEREMSGTLDADGKLQIEFPTRIDSKKQDLVYRIEARVTDAGNREIAGHGFALATYGSFFLTAEPDSFVYTKGSTATVTVTAQDYDKKPVQTPFRVEMNRWDWRKGAGPSITTAQGQTGADGKGQVKLTIPDAGEFRVRITVNTPEKRQVETTAYLWAPGESAWWSGPAQERVQIVPDRKTYKPGATAHVLIVTGKDPASVLVTAEGNGLYSGQVIKSNGGSITVDVPVKPEYAPNFYVAAVFIRDNKLYQGSKSLTVPPVQHELKVQLLPSKPQYQPGEAASYTIKATDASGKPIAGAEFSLGVVDEAIYAIKPDMTPNIMNAFYGRVYSRVSTDTSLTYYFSGQAGKRAMQLANARRSRSLAQLKPERLVQPKVRKAFPDTAYWVADVNTGSNGQATVHFNYPDAITSWRATTRGVTQDTMVGSAVMNTIVRKNLMVRLVVPRFFRRGDEVTLSTIVQNYLPTDKTARVSMEFDGLQVIDGGTKDVNVPSRGLMKVDYRVRVLNVDSARVLGKALTDVESDAMELMLPVVPFGVRLAIAKSGSIAGSGTSDTVQPLAFPPGAESGTRKLSISIAPSIAGSVFSALEFLTSYPYGCTEQTMSSFLPNVLVANAMQKLGVKSNIDPATLKKQVQAGLDRLYTYQHDDGGWGWWQSDDSHPFMTAYVLAGLSQAKAAGFEVKPDAIDRGRGWLKPYFDHSQKVKTDLRAYMAYALLLSGARETGVLDSVWSQRSTLTSYGKALLGLAMLEMNDPRANELTRELEAEARQDDSQAWWQTDMNYLMDFSGDTTPQATAYALKLLTHTAPNSPLLPKAAVYLVNHRGGGYYWDSTEQTAMVVYGLTDYLARTQELKPNYNVEVQVNGKTVTTKTFTAADALAPATTITLNESQLAPEDNQVRIAKTGNGRVYWSVRGEYYSNETKAVNTGSFKLSVAREYYKLTSQQLGDKIVYHLDKLTGPVDVGDTLAVRVTVGGNDWKYLMIEDPIPSGTESIARDDLYELNEKPDWWGRWGSYRELRDDRTTFFDLNFPQGQHEYVYLLKVVNPGVFRVSPTRVEPMYQPEYLATSDAMTVTVR